MKVLRFSKKVIICSFICVAVFTVVMTVVVVVGNRDPDTLITEFFGYFKIEGGILGMLKAVETVMDLFTVHKPATCDNQASTGVSKISGDDDVSGNI